MNKSQRLVKTREKLSLFKSHPFIVPVVAFLGLFFITMIGFIVFGGGDTIGPTDSRVVHVYVDGVRQTLPTRASTVADLLERLDVSIHDGDVVEPSIDAAIIEDNFNINIYRARPVAIIDSNKRTIVRTADQSPRIAARNAGIVIYPEDEVLPEAPADLLQEGVVGERYIINRATPITLILYGSISGIRTQSKTVGELMEEKDINIMPGDNVEPTADTVLTADMRIIITREGQQIATVEEPIEPPVEYIDDASLVRGQEAVREAGIPGKKVVTYDIQLDQDGNETSRELLQEIITIHPSRRLVARGTKIVISNPSDNVRLGEQLAAQRGWTGEQFYCLYQLWQRESGWNTTAGNTSSGAYGIPQSLPGSKMASVGADWLTNPATQINWGLGYIEGRYGSPCGAWASSQARGWY